MHVWQRLQRRQTASLRVFSLVVKQQ